MENQLGTKQEVINYIRSIYNDNEIIYNYTNIDNIPIDIYIPSIKLAIIIKETAYDMIHNDDKRTNQNRAIKCAKQGVRLVHIFQYEWADAEKQRKIKNYLKDILNSNKQKIYARKTDVRIVSKEDAKEFIDEYHLQGYTSATYNIGLYYKNELVSIMTFAKPRFNHYYDFEIIRLCTKNGVTVVGGAEKMFKRFVANFKHTYILTYADITKFTGNIYPKIGFKMERISDPNYMWVSSDSKLALPRYKTQKKKLLRMMPDIDPRMTENQIMESLGFIKVYDCGNLVLTFEK